MTHRARVSRTPEKRPRSAPETRVRFRIYGAPKPGKPVGEVLCMGSRSQRADEAKPAAPAALTED